MFFVKVIDIISSVLVKNYIRIFRSSSTAATGPGPSSPTSPCPWPSSTDFTQPSAFAKSGRNLLNTSHQIWRTFEKREKCNSYCEDTLGNLTLLLLQIMMCTYYMKCISNCPNCVGISLISGQFIITMSFTKYWKPLKFAIDIINSGSIHVMYNKDTCLI